MSGLPPGSGPIPAQSCASGWRLRVAWPLVGTGNGVSGACGGGNAPAHVPSGDSHGFALERWPYWRGRAAGPSPRVRGRSASLSSSGRRAAPRRSRRGSRRPAVGAASELHAADVMVVTSSRSGGAPSVGAEPAPDRDTKRIVAQIVALLNVPSWQADRPGRTRGAPRARVANRLESAIRGSRRFGGPTICTAITTATGWIKQPLGRS